jgi:hypothetical protein
VSERNPIRRSTLAVLFASLLLVACGGIAAAQQQGSPTSSQTLTLPAYLEEIDRWSAELTQAKSHPEDLAELRRQAPPDWTVATGAEPVKVSTDWLRVGLEKAERDPKNSDDSLDNLLAHLAALRREAQALAMDRSEADGSAPGKLQKILARREFRHVEAPNWLDRKVQSYFQWLKELETKLIELLSGHARAEHAARMVPWILLIVAAGFLMLWMIQRVLKRPPRRKLELQLSQAIPLRSWQQISQSAREAAARGEFREAIRLSYLAAVHRLEDLKFWKVDPTRTHREYLRMVRRERNEYEPLSLLTRQFELAWYGSHPVTQGDFESALSQLERLGCA